MPLEAIVLDGKGNVKVTGSLGDVMKESSEIAVSYVRSIADKYGIAPDFYKEKDIHIHAPEGATPKDGPSAGVTMTTALVSALSGIPVRHDVAMTGEITLHGKVLPIGGLREKTMAAYKAGMKDVIVPAANKADLEEVDDVVKEGLNFIFAEKLTDVLDNALAKKPLPNKKKKDIVHCHYNGFGIDIYVGKLVHKLGELDNGFFMESVKLCLGRTLIRFHYIEVAEGISGFHFHSALDAEACYKRYSYDKMIFKVAKRVFHSALTASSCSLAASSAAFLASSA